MDMIRADCLRRVEAAEAAARRLVTEMAHGDGPPSRRDLAEAANAIAQGLKAVRELL